MSIYVSEGWLGTSYETWLTAVIGPPEPVKQAFRPAHAPRPAQAVETLEQVNAREEASRA